MTGGATHHSAFYVSIKFHWKISKDLWALNLAVEKLISKEYGIIHTFISLLLIRS